MAVEIPPEVDLTIDQNLIDQANRLLGPKVTPAFAYSWINSPIKRMWEKMFVGRLGFFVALPVILAATTGVLVTDGRPVLYSIKVGFLGENDEVVRPTVYQKIRSLKTSVDTAKRDPFKTTFLRGGRKSEQPRVDPRVHSRLGHILRKSGVDEFSQLWSIAAGNVAAVGLRGYTLTELEGLKLLFKFHDQTGGIFPKGFPDDYRTAVSRVRPKPGFAGLYSATAKKDLTPPERIWLDYLYLTGANPVGDLNIIWATFKTTLQGVGSR